MSKVPSHKLYRLIALIVGVLIATTTACAPSVGTAAPDTSTTTTPITIPESTTTVPTTSSTTTSTTVAPTTTVPVTTTITVPVTTTTAPATTTTTTVPTVPTWNITLKVSYSDLMVSKYGGEQNVKDKILNQLRQVESFYTGFSHVLQLTPVIWHRYSGKSDVEANQPHVGADLLIVYEYYNDISPPGGGWDGSTHSIIQSWHNGPEEGPFDDDVFGAYPTAGLGHELGHGLGAIDLYRMDVDAGSTPISHQAYVVKSIAENTNSMMYYPYDLPGQWDTYSRCIIERSNGQLEGSTPVVSQMLPTTYKVKVTSASGASINGATVKVYPTGWTDRTVSSIDSMHGPTDATGVFQLPINPFRPMQDLSKPWRVDEPNNFVLVTYGSKTAYGWLTLANAGVAACHGQSDIIVTIALP